MDKQQEIEKMSEIIEAARIKARGYLGSMNEGLGMWLARALAEAGYGNIKGFAEKLKEKFRDKIQETFGDNSDSVQYITLDIDETEDAIDELVLEGRDEQ